MRLHRRFDLDEVLARIAGERMTLEMAVAPIALALANHPDLEDHDLSSLRYIMWGATPVTESVAEVVTKRTGVRWLPAYGASEVPVIAANPVDRPDQWRLDSAGLPPAGIELRIADLDTGEVLAPGEVGEIQVRSRSVMAGYLPDEATADAFADGWYRTGDVGWLEPEGWVHLTDRSKEMIKVNGFQVAPAEVEAVLLRHPAVLDCAVFGVADERAGEVPAAAVRARPGRPGGRGRAAGAGGRLAGHLQAPAPRGRGRRHPPPPVGEGAAPDAPGRVVGVAGRARPGTADGRPALPRAAGPPRVGRPAGRPARTPRRRPTSTTPSGRPSWTPPWPARAGGSCGSATGDGAPLASGVEAAIVAEELGRGLADVSFVGPTLAARAPPAGRRRHRARRSRPWS